MNNTSWQSVGWRITRKILYYILVVVALSALFQGSLFVLGLKSIFWWLGYLGVGLTVGLGITAILREVSLVFGKNKQNKNETNETDY
jgi:hypothetical protein